MSRLTNVVVNSVSKNGKSLKIDDMWYGAFNSSQLNGASVGDVVDFEYIEKGEYKNIKGGVVVKGKGASVASPTGSANGGKTYSRGSFPIDPLDGQRSIIRQNALTNAVKVYTEAMSPTSTSATKVPKLDLSSVAEPIIGLARQFEAYTAGDIDRTNAIALASKMDAEE